MTLSRSPSAGGLSMTGRVAKCTSATRPAWCEAATKQGANRGIVRQGQLRLGQVDLIPAGKKRHSPAGDRRWQGRMDGAPHPRAQEALGEEGQDECEEGPWHMTPLWDARAFGVWAGQGAGKNASRARCT